MDKEVRKKLIKKCREVVESNYALEVAIRTTDIRDRLLMNSIPFNILYEAYHVRTGQYLFYDRSMLLTQVLHQMVTVGRYSGDVSRAKAMQDHILKKIGSGCYRVNQTTGYIDIYDYDHGIVLFERSATKGERE